MRETIENEMNLKQLIYEVRGKKVMLGNDLAKLYGYEVKRFNEQIKRNQNIFPKGAIFKLTKEENEDCWSQICDLSSNFVTANFNISSKSRALPYAFTEQSIAVLGTIMKGENVHIVTSKIEEAFAENNSMVVSKSMMNTGEIKDLIYTIRGQQVMLDYDLADIYGYSTRAFNQQVRNNINKFESDFMFQLNESELEILKSKNLTSSWGGTRKLPNVFTEQGVYMLMTVLKGELATQQTKSLIRAFKEMRHYYMENQFGRNPNDFLYLNTIVSKHTESINELKKTAATKDELSKLADNFIDPMKVKSFVFHDGEKFEADVIYHRIYTSAKESIIILDDYISLETLNKLNHVDSSISITIITTNKSPKDKLQKSEYEHFLNKHPNTTILKGDGKVHDRFIIIDYDTEQEKLYQCGGSSKDAGHKLTTITTLNDIDSSSLDIRSRLTFPSLF